MIIIILLNHLPSGYTYGLTYIDLTFTADVLRIEKNRLVCPSGFLTSVV